jgi:hypothetical protein
LGWESRTQVTGLAATLGKAGRGSEALALYETCAETNPKVAMGGAGHLHRPVLNHIYGRMYL